MKTYRVASLAPGDVAFLPIATNQYTARPVTVAWVREERDGAVRVGWRAEGEDHVLRVPLHLAAVGARLVAATRCGQAPSAVVMTEPPARNLPDAVPQPAEDSFRSMVVARARGRRCREKHR